MWWRPDYEDDCLLAAAQGLGLWEARWGYCDSPGDLRVLDFEGVIGALWQAATDYAWALFQLAEREGLLVLLDRKRGAPAPCPLGPWSRYRT